MAVDRGRDIVQRLEREKIVQDRGRVGAVLVAHDSINGIGK